MASGHPDKLAVIGLGQIGGSVLRAAVERRAAARVAGWDLSARTRAAVAGAGLGRHLASDLAAACREAELVLVAVPARQIPVVVDRARRVVPAGGVVTDTGSTKAWILDEVRRLEDGQGGLAPFVGGHPMAGSDRGGFNASAADLLTGQPWLLIAPKEGSQAGEGERAGVSAPVEAVAEFVDALGARPVLTRPEAHDRLVALTSQLPYLLALALAGVGRRAAGRGGAAALADFAAGGFRDSSRLALQGPESGAGMLTTNLGRLREALAGLEGELARLLEALATGPGPAPCARGAGKAARLIRRARAFRAEVGRLKGWTS